MGWNDRIPFETLKGKTIKSIHRLAPGNDDVIFECEGGTSYRMYHYQDCCESVSITEVIGDVADIIGSPVLLAEEVSEEAKDVSESGTWTFYKLSTIQGSVTIRWLGESNGYYSESVDFEEIK